jgi:hypothetical protein
VKYPVLVAVLCLAAITRPGAWDVGPKAAGDGIRPRALTYYEPSICWDAACTTASGWPAFVVEGAAACGAAFPLWTRLRFEGTDYVATCIDRGAPWHFYSTEVDLFVRSHAEGRWLVDWLDGRTVEVLE